MNTSINYSGFINTTQNSQEEIESRDNTEMTDTLDYRRHLLQSYLLDIDDIDHSYDM